MSLPSATAPTAVRNVVLAGHSGAGKTALVQALLGAATGRRPSDDAGRTTGLGFYRFTHAGITVNVLDTPGYADFVGDLRAGLRAADGALFVVSAVDGVDGATQALWEECAAVGMPRAVVITKLDSPRADFDAILAICQRVFGEGVQPLYLPLHTGDAEAPGGVGGLIGLLSQQLFDYTSGARVERTPDSEHLPLIADSRAALIEGIIAESEDETLMDRYLAGEEIDVKLLVEDLERAVARGSFHPVVGASATTGLGTLELLEVLTQGFPSPTEHPLPVISAPDGSPHDPLMCDPAGPLCAEVVKTTTDPYVGRISLVRVFSGTLRPDHPVHVSGHGLAERGHEDHDVDERTGILSLGTAKGDPLVSECAAGDLCYVAKLVRAETGDTLSDKETPLLVEAWQMPEPLLPIAVAAKSKTDEDKLGQAMYRIVSEDPTLRLERNTETHQQVLWCMGEAHADLVLERLRAKFGVEVEQLPLRVPLRETFAGPARGHGRHVKQSGGHGQYAICDIEVEPLAGGSGFEFVDKVVGGAVPNTFIPSVEKGVRAQLEKGVAAGYPLVDVRVTLVDGKSHSVDSSDMAFQMAGAQALRDAAEHGAVSLLEPVLDVTVVVPDGYVGPVMSDLSGRRGRVAGTEPLGSGPLGSGSGRTVIRAEVPEVELVRYAIDLRSLSHGTASFTRHYLRHEPMPATLAARHLSPAG